MVELVSPSDTGPQGAEALRRKMTRFRSNGTCLSWLLFPEERPVEFWSAERVGGGAVVVERIEAAEVLEGGEMFPGLRLELAEAWEASAAMWHAHPHAGDTCKGSPLQAADACVIACECD